MLARSRTGLATGNETNGNSLTIAEPSPGAPGCWPNESKLSDRHRRGKTKRSEVAPPPVPVRWSAWLGPRLQSGWPE